MKKMIFFPALFLAVLFLTLTCRKDDSDDDNGSTASSNWNLKVTDPGGDTITIATGAFTFATTSFTAHIKTSRIGGGNIVKEFDMSGTRSGDSIKVSNCVLNLTDPEEIVTVNGRIGLSANTMSGTGTYSGYEPPDTMHFNGSFVLNAVRQ